MPILHKLLGLGNDLMWNFWGYVEEGAEPLEPAERVRVRVSRLET
jgi:hypothetical protein